MPFLPPNQQRQSTEGTVKMDEKLKSENMQKRAVFYVYIGQAGVENGAMLTTFIHIYFRMHHFVVKFSKFSSPQAARGH